MMVHPASLRVSRAPSYSGCCLGYGAGFRIRGSNPLWPDFSDRSPILPRPFVGSPTTPAGQARRFGLFPVRSPLLGESLLISVPAGTEMFQFPAFALAGLWIRPGVRGYDPSRVAPFGDLRIKGCLRLPEAYRSLPRPSSLPGAKASTLRPFVLDFCSRLGANAPPNCSRGLAQTSGTLHSPARPARAPEGPNRPRRHGVSRRAPPPGPRLPALHLPDSSVKDPPGHACRPRSRGREAPLPIPLRP